MMVRGAAFLGPPSIAILDALRSDTSRVPLANSKSLADTALRPRTTVFGGVVSGSTPLVRFSVGRE